MLEGIVGDAVKIRIPASESNCLFMLTAKLRAAIPPHFHFVPPRYSATGQPIVCADICMYADTSLLKVCYSCIYIVALHTRILCQHAHVHMYVYTLPCKSLTFLHHYVSNVIQLGITQRIRNRTYRNWYRRIARANLSKQCDILSVTRNIGNDTGVITSEPDGENASFVRTSSSKFWCGY
jgi:hypothetical protein